MNESVSIFQLRINYNDFVKLSSLFLAVNYFVPFLLIILIVLVQNIFYWIFSIINKNSYWKYIYIIKNFFTYSRYWGIVIDDRTLDPVCFAKVKLIKFDQKKDKIVKKVIATTLTDINGKYNFNYKGDLSNLFIEVNAFGYKKYYKEIDTMGHVIENSEIIYDVFLSSKNQNFRIYLGIRWLSIVVNILVFLIATYGLLISIFALLSTESSESFIFCTLYIYILYTLLTNAFKSFTLKKLEVRDSLLMQKISGAVVRLYDQKHQLHIAVTNTKGYVLIDWVPGVHQVLVTKKGYELMDDATGMRNKKAYLTNNKYVKLKQKFKTLDSLNTKTKSTKAKTSLENPFSKSL